MLPTGATTWIAIVLIVLMALIVGYVIWRMVRRSRKVLVHSEEQEPFVSTEEEGGQGTEIRFIYVYSEDCPYCKAFTPKFMEVYPMFAKVRPNQTVLIDKVRSSDAAPDLMRYVTSFPTVLMFINGTYYRQMSGNQDKAAIMDFMMSAP